MVITVLILLCSCVNVKKKKELIKHLESKEEFESANRVIDELLVIDPTNIDLIIDKGVNYSYMENHPKAIQCYSDVIQIDSNITLAYYNRACNLISLNKNREALVDVNKAISLKGGDNLHIDFVPNSFIDNYKYDVKMANIIYLRGRCYYDLDSADLAFKDFNRCVNSSEENMEFLYFRGLTYCWMGYKNEGCSDLRKARKKGFKFDDEDLINNCGGI